MSLIGQKMTLADHNDNKSEITYQQQRSKLSNMKKSKSALKMPPSNYEMVDNQNLITISSNNIQVVPSAENNIPSIKSAQRHKMTRGRYMSREQDALRSRHNSIQLEHEVGANSLENMNITINSMVMNNSNDDYPTMMSRAQKSIG